MVIIIFIFIVNINLFMLSSKNYYEAKDSFTYQEHRLYAILRKLQ